MPSPPSDLPPAAGGHAPSAVPQASGPVITTPAGSTIEPVAEGGYLACDAGRHCLPAPTLWQAQQLVQWAEVHHQPLEAERADFPTC